MNAPNNPVDDTFFCIAVLKAKPQKSEALRNYLLALIEPTRQEPGCLDYVLFESIEDPGVFYMRESFKNQAAFDVHSQTAHFQNFRKVFDEVLAEPIKLIRLNKISS